MKSSRLSRLMGWYKRHPIGITLIIGALITLTLASVALIPHFLPHYLGSVSAVKAELSDMFDYTGWNITGTGKGPEVIVRNINKCITLIRVIGEPVKVIEMEAELRDKVCLQKVHNYFIEIIDTIGSGGWWYKRKQLENDLDKTLEGAWEGETRVERETLKNSYFNGYEHYNQLDYPQIYTYDVERLTFTSDKTGGEQIVKLRLEAL